MMRKIIEMRYQLDLETLLLFLSNRGQSGELSADLKSFSGIAHHELCHAYVTVMKGKVISCSIQDHEGRVLVEGSIALSRLKKMGPLDWAWSLTTDRTSTHLALPTHPTTPPASAGRGPLDLFSLIPRRIVLIGTKEKNELPRKHWRVLILIDGSHTVAQIASILSLTSLSGTQELISILNDLQRRGIIKVVD